MDVNAFETPFVDWYSLSPFIVLLAGVLVLIGVGSLTPRWPKGLYAAVTAVTAGAAITLLALRAADLGEAGNLKLMKESLALDRFGWWAMMAICLAVLLSALVTSDVLARNGVDGPETYALYLTAAIGAGMMVVSNDLLISFLGIETLSLSLYVLAASNRRRASSQESGLKYFLLGGFASAFLLYGIALVYGATGETLISGIGSMLGSEVSLPRNDLLLLVGVALLFVGFAFKVALVPFQSWTPDVYEGAPTHVTGLMASVGKVAAVVAMVRLFVVAFPSRADDWRPVVFAVAILTLVVGSVLAVVQTNVKRMLAYSSISHAGFMLVGLEAAGRVGSSNAGEGTSAVLVYVMLYSVLVVGTFAVTAVVAGDRGGSSLEDFRGLSKRRPALALAMTILLLAQAGVPLTSGFVAKFGVIRAAVATESYVLAVAAMIAAVVAAYLYLRIMVSMWLAEPQDSSKMTVPFATSVTVAVSVAVTLVLGVFPALLLDSADLFATLSR